MKNIPRIRFAHLPTPVDALPRISAYLGVNILVKRDDQTGQAFGGNKTRKLELLMASALEQGAKTLLTAGAVQSNHCRQTAAVAVRFGCECILVLSGKKPPAHSGNLLLDRLFGAEFVWTERSRRDVILDETFNKARKAGRLPYLIPYGGSNPVGAFAYTIALEELIQQGIKTDWIVFPTSSGGTQAGLVFGTRLFNFNGKVLGISVDEREEVLRERVVDLANAIADQVEENVKVEKSDVLVNSDYLGHGYGVMGETEREAIHLFARYEGLLLDPVYTGRAAGGMIDLIRKGFFGKGDTILFWHTGGTPALFADAYRNELA